jgi:hypothetical protein
MEMLKKGPLFSMFSTLLLCPSLKLLLLLFCFFRSMALLDFGGFEFVGLALVGKDIVF